MDITSSQEVAGVDDDPDPEVILEADPSRNLVIAHNAVSGEAVKFLQTKLGAPGYFPGGVGPATRMQEMPCQGVYPDKGPSQESTGKFKILCNSINILLFFVTNVPR